MATYMITLMNRGQDWIAVVKTYLYVKNEAIEIREENNTFHSKYSAFESIMMRFNDLDFENDHLIINGNEAASIHDMARLFEREFVLSKTA